MFSQDLKVDAVSLGIGYFRSNFSLNSNLSEYSTSYGGVSYQADMLLIKQKHLLSIKSVYNEDLAIFGKSTLNILEFNLLYGREITVSKRFYIQPFLGCGYLRLNDKNFYNQDNFKENKIFNKIAIPLQLNIGVKLSNRFGIGLTNAYNINSLTSLYTQHLYFKYSFNKKGATAITP